MPRARSTSSMSGGASSIATWWIVRALVNMRAPGRCGDGSPRQSRLCSEIVVKPASVMPGLPSAARSTMTAAPASPSVSEASWRLRMLRTSCAAFVPRPVMYSPLTTMPRRITPRRMRSFRMKTPVIIPAQALDRSKFMAACAPMASLIERLSGGSKRCDAPPW